VLHGILHGPFRRGAAGRRIDGAVAVLNVGAPALENPARPHERRLTMPQILSTILTQVAVALVEAILVRLIMQLWKSFAASGRPVAAAA
jgi:hypothetical protein